MKGAEATVTLGEFCGKKAVKKDRVQKAYRQPALDISLRTSRTKSEARLLASAKTAGVSCPVVYSVERFCITMSFLDGELLSYLQNKEKMNAGHVKTAASILARLHDANIIHGDFSPANLIAGKRGVFVIDFGLGYVSQDDEDKAVDVLTMKCALPQKLAAAFVAAYSAHSKENARIAKLAKEVESRARYAERTG
jgi:N6-L-threonylcarbamoyladenine synthase/protein kinase Bud32